MKIPIGTEIESSSYDEKHDTNSLIMPSGNVSEKHKDASDHFTHDQGMKQDSKEDVNIIVNRSDISVSNESDLVVRFVESAHEHMSLEVKDKYNFEQSIDAQLGDSRNLNGIGAKTEGTKFQSDEMSMEVKDKYNFEQIIHIQPHDKQIISRDDLDSPEICDSLTHSTTVLIETIEIDANKSEMAILEHSSLDITENEMREVNIKCENDAEMRDMETFSEQTNKTNANPELDMADKFDKAISSKTEFLSHEDTDDAPVEDDVNTVDEVLHLHVAPQILDDVSKIDSLQESVLSDPVSNSAFCKGDISLLEERTELYLVDKESNGPTLMISYGEPIPIPLKYMHGQPIETESLTPELFQIIPSNNAESDTDALTSDAGFISDVDGQMDISETSSLADQLVDTKDIQSSSDLSDMAHFVDVDQFFDQVSDEHGAVGSLIDVSDGKIFEMKDDKRDIDIQNYLERSLCDPKETFDPNLMNIHSDTYKQRMIEGLINVTDGKTVDRKDVNREKDVENYLERSLFDPKEAFDPNLMNIQSGNDELVAEGDLVDVNDVKIVDKKDVNRELDVEKYSLKSLCDPTQAVDPSLMNNQSDNDNVEEPEKEEVTKKLDVQRYLQRAFCNPSETFDPFSMNIKSSTDLDESFHQYGQERVDFDCLDPNIIHENYEKVNYKWFEFENEDGLTLAQFLGVHTEDKVDVIWLDDDGAHSKYSYGRRPILAGKGSRWKILRAFLDKLVVKWYVKTAVDLQMCGKFELLQTKQWYFTYNSVTLLIKLYTSHHWQNLLISIRLYVSLTSLHEQC